MAVSMDNRFKRGSECPICGGHSGMRSGKGTRCWGFINEKGRYVYCTREEFAGSAPYSNSAGAYRHFLGGQCRCGATHDAGPIPITDGGFYRTIDVIERDLKALLTRSEAAGSAEQYEADRLEYDALWRELETVKTAATAPPGSPWDERWITVPDLWYSTVPTKRRWLFRDARLEGSPGVFPLGKAGQLVAAGGVGKTMMLISLARAVASGSRWLGSFDCGEPGAVLLFLGEEDAEEAQRRLYNAAKRDGAAPANSIVIVPLAGLDCAMLARDAAGNPTETAFLAWARSHIAKRDDWRLIIIDPMSRFAGPDAEKDNAIGTRYVQVLESLATPERSVLNAHHTPQSARGKGAIEAPRGRGVTAAFDGFRWEAALSSEEVSLEDTDDRRRLGEIVTLRFTKSNYSKKAEPVQMRRDEFGALVVLDETDQEIVDAAKGKGLSKEQRKEQRLEAAQAKRRAQDSADDAAALRVRVENPKASVRALKSILMSVLSCGSDRAFNAIQRTQEREVTL